MENVFAAFAAARLAARARTFYPLLHHLRSPRILPRTPPQTPATHCGCAIALGRLTTRLCAARQHTIPPAMVKEGQRIGTSATLLLFYFFFRAKSEGSYWVSAHSTGLKNKTRQKSFSTPTCTRAGVVSGA